MGENGLNMEHAERSFSVLGHKSVLNLLCIILSDCLLNSRGESLEAYTAFPLLNPNYKRIFQRIIFVPGAHIGDITLHHLISNDFLQKIDPEANDDFFPLFMGMQRQLDLHLWRVPEPLEQHFLLVKGKLLLIFSPHLGGTPLMVPIYHKGHLALHYNALLKHTMQKMTYSAPELTALLSERPDALSRLTGQGIDSVYNFVTIGYLPEEREPDRPDVAEASRVLAELFGHILSNKIDFFVSISTMERFITFGKAVVPLLGVVDIPLAERSSYLKRLNSYIEKGGGFEKFKVLNSELVNIALLFARDCAVLYAVDDDYSRERFYIFRQEKMCALLRHAVEKNAGKPLELFPDLWKLYLDEQFFDRGQKG